MRFFFVLRLLLLSRTCVKRVLNSTFFVTLTDQNRSLHTINSLKINDLRLIFLGDIDWTNTKNKIISHVKTKNMCTEMMTQKEVLRFCLYFCSINNESTGNKGGSIDKFNIFIIFHDKIYVFLLENDLSTIAMNNLFCLINAVMLSLGKKKKSTNFQSNRRFHTILLFFHLLSLCVSCSSNLCIYCRAIR